MAGNRNHKDKGFLLQGSILAIAGVITKLIGAVYRVPLVNIIGDEGMGYYGIAFQIYSIALTLTSYSLPLAVSKLVSARVARGEYKNSHRVFRGAMTFAIIVSGLVGAVIFFGSGFIAEQIMSVKFSAYALRVLAPCILVVAILGVMRGFFQGNGSMIPTAFSQVLEQIVNAGVSIAGAYMLFQVGMDVAKIRGNDSYGAAYSAAGGTLGTVIGALSALLFLLFVYAVYKRILKRKMRRDRGHRKESFRRIYKILFITIAPVILSSTVYNLCGVIDNAMFAKIMSVQGHKTTEYTSLIGILNGKYDTLINVPISIAYSLGASLIPAIVTAAQTGSRKQVHNKIQLVTKFNMMIAIPCAAGFIVLAEPILDLLFFTQDNKVGGLMLQLGALSVVFYCLSTVTNAVLQGLDNMMAPVKNATISLVLYTISLFVMLVVFRWGIYAVVLSRIVFSGSTSILNAHSLRMQIGYVQEQQKTFIIPAIASVIMGVIALGIHLLFELFSSTQVATLVALPVAVVVYAMALVMLGGVSEQEMYEMPKGALLVRVCRKAGLFR